MTDDDRLEQRRQLEAALKDYYDQLSQENEKDKPNEKLRDRLLIQIGRTQRNLERAAKVDKRTQAARIKKEVAESRDTRKVMTPQELAVFVAKVLMKYRCGLDPEDEENADSLARLTKRLLDDEKRMASLSPEERHREDHQKGGPCDFEGCRGLE